MTPEEKQYELKRHRDIILATIDYTAAKLEKAHITEATLINHFEQLKKATEVYYQKGSLTKLKQWLRDLLEDPRGSNDLHFEKYIKARTGYDIDIFDDFRKRIGNIIQRKRIKTANEYRDVLSILNDVSLTENDYKIELLSKLAEEFEIKSNTKRASGK